MVRYGFQNFCFWNRFVTEMLRTMYGMSRELLLDVLYGIYKNWTFWTKSRLFPRLSMAEFMAGND